MHRTGQSAAEQSTERETAPDPTPGLHGRTLERVSEGLHRVMEGDEVRGYIEEAGSVFVSLSGPHYGHAIEIGQSLTLERAVLAFSLIR